MALHRASANSSHYSDDSPMRSFGQIGMERKARELDNELLAKKIFADSVNKDEKRDFDMWSTKQKIKLDRETGSAQRFAGLAGTLGQGLAAWGGARMDAAADAARDQRFLDFFGGGGSSSEGSVFNTPLGSFGSIGNSPTFDTSNINLGKIWQ